MDIRNSYLRYGIIDRLGLGPEGALAACFVQAMDKHEINMRLVVIFLLQVLLLLEFSLMVDGGCPFCFSGCEWSS